MREPLHIVRSGYTIVSGARTRVGVHGDRDVEVARVRQGAAAGARAQRRGGGAEGGARRGRGRGRGGGPRGRPAPRPPPPARAALPRRADAPRRALHVPRVRAGRGALRQDRAGRGHGGARRAPLLAAAARRAGVLARARSRPPRHQAREPAARPPRRPQDIRLRNGHGVQARGPRAAGVDRVRHGAVRRARGAGRRGAALPRAARRPLVRGRGAARDAGRRAPMTVRVGAELPWGRAADGEPRYEAWRAWASRRRGAGGEGAPPAGPWRKASGAARALLARALDPRVERRPPLHALLRHRWTEDVDEGVCRVWRSQPLCAEAEGEGDAESAVAALVSRSQPGRADELLLATQSDCTQPTQASVARRLRVRMTRAWVAADAGGATRALEAALAALGLPWRRGGGGGGHSLDVECGAEVRMRVAVVRASPGPLALVEFRRLRGCGMHFKRRFAQVRDALRPLLAPSPPPSPPPPPTT